MMVPVVNFGAPPQAVSSQPLSLRRVSFAGSSLPGNWVTLNPQPLPPHQDVFTRSKAAYTAHVTNSPLFKIPQADRGIVTIGGRSEVRFADAVLPKDVVGLNQQPLPSRDAFSPASFRLNVSGYCSQAADSAGNQGITIIGGRSAIR